MTWEKNKREEEKTVMGQIVRGLITEVCVKSVLYPDGKTLQKGLPIRHVFICAL